MPPRKPSPVGAHVPVSAGLVSGGLRYASEVGAEAIQIFVGNPRGWARTPGDVRQDQEFVRGCAERRITTFVHAPYLVNLGSPTGTTVAKSRDAVAHAVGRGFDLAARGVVVHTGSAVDGGSRATALRQVREALLPILDSLPDDGPDLLIEPTAGSGASLCAGIDDLGEYLDVLEQHPRVGVCLDTCHAFAAGHDLAAPGGMRRTLDRLVRVTGKGRLRLVHANDSKDLLGSRRDRHEQIGKGHIGEAPFAELFRHAATRNVCVVVETPGRAPGHRHDIERLKTLRDQ